MLGQKNWLVIMVTKNSLQLIGLGDEQVQVINFTPATISNMEVVNKDNLYTLITDWLKGRPHTNTSIIWLLAPDVYFEHTLTSNEQDKVDSETLQFLDTVPFEEVISRIYKPLEWRQIIAINKDLIMSLIQSFTLHGHETKAVVPAKLIQADAVLTPEIEHNAIKKIAELSRDSLVSASSPQANFVAPLPEQSGSGVKPKSSLPLLLGVFGILLAILAFVIYLNY